MVMMAFKRSPRNVWKTVSEVKERRPSAKATRFSVKTSIVSGAKVWPNEAISSSLARAEHSQRLVIDVNDLYHAGGLSRELGMIGEMAPEVAHALRAQLIERRLD